eukprot:5616147-Prymnesium_polylepis.1
MPAVTPSCGTHWQALALIGTHRHITIVSIVSLILCAGTILHHTFGCCNSSCIDVSKIVIQVMQEYLLGWALARMRISVSRIAFRLIQPPSMFVLSQYTREIMFLIIASCVHCAHVRDEASPEYTKLLNVEIWDSIPSPSG